MDVMVVKKLVKCDYCNSDIDSHSDTKTIEKVWVRLITTGGKLVDNCYHVRCFLDSMKDPTYLKQLGTRFIAEIL